MSSTSPIARRYAQALHDEAESLGRAERLDADVAAVREAIAASRELERLFASPVVPRDRKLAVAERLFAGTIDELVLRVIRLLVEKGREALLLDVMRAYEALRDERLGRAEALVRTALPLSPEDEQALAARLSALTGRSIRLRVTVEPELIGGLVVRIGDTVYDGSARHQLDRLRSQFAEGIFQSIN